MSSSSASTSLLLPLPSSLSSLPYRHEGYITTGAIPELEDPLPYQKSAGVFGEAETRRNGDNSGKFDARIRTVVCRHWLKGLCMKNEKCEFLHQYDLEKMPLCRHGERCKVEDCPFRHIKEADRLVCVFYTQGFCVHGPHCRYKHVQRGREDLPQVANFTQGLSQMQAGAESMQPRRAAAQKNEFFKVSLCKHFLSGSCPFGDGCHFAHGETDLARNRDAPKARDISENIFGGMGDDGSTPAE
ncbi:hypothetical protein TeGR_g5504 [Tetraparma gracilis]|uniref:C3H1-type domain-containing protein n=1 Tax=Tetraparma gracilis TaxID=2962635 RepID=A0ABQ6MH96_9STRA|nr:hypothetical protein TeGR_g5504 [Tetraparma gracilis]